MKSTKDIFPNIFTMNYLTDFNFSGKKALVRVDFNVPLDDHGQITDDTRLRAAVPTIKKIIEEGGSVIVMSHLGRPENGPEEKTSLTHILTGLSKLLGVEVQFANDCIGKEAMSKAATLKSGEVLLLENVRFYKEETAGDQTFAAKLSQLGDIYVNDAFGTAHRAHASTTSVAEFFEEKCCGFVMQQELDNATKVLENVEQPFTVIMGGAKISDKISIIDQLIDVVDHLIVGGGMSYTFFKALGGNIGNSLVEEDKLECARELMTKAREKEVKLHLPKDAIVAMKFSNETTTKVTNSYAIEEGWMGLDIGPEAAEVFSSIIEKSRTILWNGPMGVFEMNNFSKGTKRIAEAVVSATEAGGFSLIGGGDSAAAVHQLGYGEKVSYVSTGGGALLEFIEGKVLPGVKALG